MTTTIQLPPVSLKFILHWGEMGSRWGVNRSVAQIHALLFLSDRPLTAEEISETLAIARSNVSNSLKELSSLNLIKTLHQMGDRRDYFETSKDVWDLFRTIVNERKLREFDPTLQLLEECLQHDKIELESKAARQRIKDTHELMDALSGWTEQMLRLDNSMLTKILKLGGRIKAMLNIGKAKS